jgi:cell division protein FtsB
VPSAAAAARPLPAPRHHEDDEGRGAPRRRPGATRAPRPRFSTLPVRLLVFGILLAVLAVGRVTLSFAVVQKNLQTDAVVREYRRLDAQNQRLAEKAAGLSSALAIRNTAITKYHLVVSPSAQFVRAHPGTSKTTATRR